jgi:hypothetical protein
MLVTQIEQPNKRVLELNENRSLVLKRQHLLLRARRQSNKMKRNMLRLIE